MSAWCVGALIVPLFVLSPVGCDGIRSKGAGTAAAPVAQQAWPFTPTEMRFHPFTAVSADPEAETTLIEARVTFHDQWGDTTKAMGRLQFVLSLPDSAGPDDPARRRRINSWDADLSQPEHSAVHFESISRTYLFKLRLPQMLPADRTLRLTAQFNDVNGNRLRAETELALEAEGE